jgi:DNA-binding response OmpR family regulator
MPAELDHASSLEEAKTMLLRGQYGLVLFEHEMGDAAATKLLAEFLQTGCAVPFIVLAELADEKADSHAGSGRRRPPNPPSAVRKPFFL